MDTCVNSMTVRLEIEVDLSKSTSVRDDAGIVALCIKEQVEKQVYTLAKIISVEGDMRLTQRFKV